MPKQSFAQVSCRKACRRRSISQDSEEKACRRRSISQDSQEKLAEGENELKDKLLLLTGRCIPVQIVAESNQFYAVLFAAKAYFEFTTRFGLNVIPAVPDVSIEDIPAKPDAGVESNSDVDGVESNSDVETDGGND